MIMRSYCGASYKRAKKKRGRLERKIEVLVRENRVQSAELLRRQFEAMARRDVGRGLLHRASLQGKLSRARAMLPERATVGSSVELVDALVASRAVNEREASLARRLHVTSLQELVAYAQAFPNEAGAFMTPRVQNAFAMLDQRFASSSAAAARAFAQVGKLTGGASPPPSSSARRDKKRMLQLAASGTLSTLPILPGRGAVWITQPNWTVRDQGQRGTCVAFAASACLEHEIGSDAWLSAWYTYWALKTTNLPDPYPKEEGTSLGRAASIMPREGTCTEKLWEYSESRPLSELPSSSARDDAVARRPRRPAKYESFYGLAPEVPKAAPLYEALSNGRAVAISLPVFRETGAPRDNWNQDLALLYGTVLDLPPNARVELSGGHAVCVVGYVPDERAPGGGWFVFKNSWSTAWAQQNDAATPSVCSGPAPGYGRVSCQYVDCFLWELYQLG